MLGLGDRACEPVTPWVWHRGWLGRAWLRRDTVPPSVHWRKFGLIIHMAIGWYPHRGWPMLLEVMRTFASQKVQRPPHHVGLRAKHRPLREAEHHKENDLAIAPHDTD